jgi:hypothetical protein
MPRRHPETFCQQLAHRHGHVACHHGHMQLAVDILYPSLNTLDLVADILHIAGRRGRLVPGPRHPSLDHRGYESFSAAPQMSSVPPLVSSCPTSPGCPRFLGFPSKF